MPRSAHDSRQDAAVGPATTGGTSGEQVAVLTEAELIAVLSSSTVSAQLDGPMRQAPTTVQYRVEPDGPTWWWSTRGEHPSTGIGEVADADIEVNCGAAIARALLDGTLDVSKAVLVGKVRVRGDLGPLLGQAKPAPREPVAGDG